MTDRETKAMEYFQNNFNCAQSVLGAFAEDAGMSEALALSIATNFGGGARKAEMCGAVSGALMALGLFCNHTDGSDQETKAEAYALSEEFMDRFIRENGSVVCRNLLGFDLTKPEEKKQIEELRLFKTRCPELIKSSARLLDDMLAELKEPGPSRPGASRTTP